MDTSHPAPASPSKDENATQTASPQQGQQPEPYRQVAAAHIATLSEINHQLPKMLRYFATALTQLTDHPIPDALSSTTEDSNATATATDTAATPDTLETRRAAFRKYATYAGYSVNIIREELVRQIEDLEKHNVIPASHPKFTVARRHGDRSVEEAVDPQASVRNGGYGEFDVGVLNARASAGSGGDGEVLERLRGVLEELERRRVGQKEEEREGRKEEEDREDEMVVDG